MNPTLNFTPYKRRPFEVEAVQITEDNIEECALLIGELDEKDGEPFVRINKRIVPNIHRAYVGWWITRMDDNLRCYSSRIFDEQFEPNVSGFPETAEERWDSLRRHPTPQADF